MFAKEKMLKFKYLELYLKIVKPSGKVNKAIIGIKDKNLAEAIKKQICGGEVFGEG